MSDEATHDPTAPPADVDRSAAASSSLDGARATALVLAEPSSLRLYKAPAPGRSLRSLLRVGVLMGGSAAIGVAVAVGALSVGGAAVVAVGLASLQVFSATWRQNRLGQDVLGGIATGDLDRAQRAAEKALVESAPGAVRTLAASNLASVLIQRDRVQDAAAVLDRFPPGLWHMPFVVALWLNNRAFAHMATGRPSEIESAAPLLDEAEARVAKASTRELGGPLNARKLTSALAGTRALERVYAKDGKTALTFLARAAEHDVGPPAAYRIAERELCRIEALRLVGKSDEAALALEATRGSAMTERQRARFTVLEQRLGLA
jgi:hypothetical protein